MRDANEPNKARVAAVFAEVNRGTDSDHEGHDHRPDHEQCRANDARPNSAGRISDAGGVNGFLVRFLPFPEFPIAQLHFFALIVEDVERLRRLCEKFHIDERRVIGEYRPASFDRDIEKDVGGAREHEVRGETKGPKHERLDKAAPAVGRGCDHFIPDLVVAAGVDRGGLARGKIRDGRGHRPRL